MRSHVKEATLALVGLCAAAATTGCPSDTTATGFTPITGIEILSSALVAGHGCGNGPDQVYRYAAIVSYATDAGSPVSGGTLQVANLFDCFADGVFENLPTSDSGSQNFFIQILAYNRASFPADLSCPPAGTPCPAQDPAAVTNAAAQATWSTTCTATQQQGVPVLAVCGALVPNASANAGGDDAAAPADAPNAPLDAGADSNAGKAGDGAPESSVEAEEASTDGGAADAGAADSSPDATVDADRD